MQCVPFDFARQATTHEATRHATAFDRFHRCFGTWPNLRPIHNLRRSTTVTTQQRRLNNDDSATATQQRRLANDDSTTVTTQQVQPFSADKLAGDIAWWRLIARLRPRATATMCRFLNTHAKICVHMVSGALPDAWRASALNVAHRLRLQDTLEACAAALDGHHGADAALAMAPLLGEPAVDAAWAHSKPLK